MRLNKRHTVRVYRERIDGAMAVVRAECSEVRHDCVYGAGIMRLVEAGQTYRFGHDELTAMLADHIDKEHYGQLPYLRGRIAGVDY